MFRWIKERLGRFRYESGWTVNVSETFIGSTDPEGESQKIPKQGLHKVLIVTDESGPWGEDLFWLGYDENGQLAFAFPLGSRNERRFIEYLMTLPGYNDDQLIKVMSSTSAAEFIVYKRPGND